jgi:restriction endonuclease Mrr
MAHGASSGTRDADEGGGSPLSLLLLFNQAVIPEEQWNPEQNLPEEERLLLLPEDLCSGIALPTNLAVIDRLVRQPTEVFSLSPWQFQEFVAELLRRSGYEVKLGPKGPDNGIDIFAERSTDVGCDLALVQCKRNAPENKVTRAVVKELYGTVEERRATRGLIVTTSTSQLPRSTSSNEYAIE